jgi:hypothetical protein
MVLHGLGAPGRVRIAEPPLAVAHDEVLVHALAGGALVHLGEVRRIGGLVLEERVDVLDRFDPEVALRDPAEVQMVELLRAERPTERPLGQ